MSPRPILYSRLLSLRNSFDWSSGKSLIRRRKCEKCLLDPLARDFPLIQEVMAKMACRSKVPPRKRANEETRVNSITVGTFCPSTPVVKIPINPGVSNVRTLKIAVAERLKLYCGSHNIFGLYLGVKLLSSFKILQDDDIMTPNMLGDGTLWIFQKSPLLLNALKW